MHVLAFRITFSLVSLQALLRLVPAHGIHGGLAIWQVFLTILETPIKKRRTIAILDSIDNLSLCDAGGWHRWRWLAGTAGTDAGGWHILDTLFVFSTFYNPHHYGVTESYLFKVLVFQFSVSILYKSFQMDLLANKAFSCQVKVTKLILLSERNHGGNWLSEWGMYWKYLLYESNKKGKQNTRGITFNAFLFRKLQWRSFASIFKYFSIASSRRSNKRSTSLFKSKLILV